MYEEMIGGLYEREYRIAFRAHTVGMEEMPISPATLRLIGQEASEEVDRILTDKKDRLYGLLRKRRK